MMLLLLLLLLLFCCVQKAILTSSNWNNTHDSSSSFTTNPICSTIIMEADSKSWLQQVVWVQWWYDDCSTVSFCHSLSREPCFLFLPSSFLAMMSYPFRKTMVVSLMNAVVVDVCAAIQEKNLMWSKFDCIIEGIKLFPAQDRNICILYAVEGSSRAH